MIASRYDNNTNKLMSIADIYRNLLVNQPE